MTYVTDFLFCAGATLCFSFLINVPKKAMIIAPVTAGLSYILYELIMRLGASEPAAIFAGTLAIAVSGEICARVLKMPSTMFTLPGVIPFVPGLGIYKTMLALIRNDFESFQKTGTNTLMVTLAMAMAIAFINVIARHIFTNKNMKR